MAIHKILIVDDSTTDLMALQDAVVAANCTVVVAHSGAEAVSKAKDEQPDLTFMDILMDNMNGYDACREIKADSTTATPSFFHPIVHPLGSVSQMGDDFVVPGLLFLPEKVEPPLS